MNNNSGVGLNTSDLETNKNEIKKKKKRVLYPNIRFNLEIDSGNDICEYNFNTIMLKALRLKQKLVGENASDSDAAIKKASLIEKDFFVDYERLPELISIFERKISLNRGLNYCDVDDDDYDESGENGEEGDLTSEEEGEEDEIGDGEDVNIENSEDEDEDEDESEGNEDESDDIDGDETDNDASSHSGPNVRIKSENFARWAKGYDENDSFIDNAEAVEERLPSNKRPKHGKFYVNKDQKIQLVKTKPNQKKSDDSNDSNLIATASKKTARRVSSSSSNHSIEEIPVKKMKKSDDAEKAPQAVKPPKPVVLNNKIQSSSSSSSPVLLQQQQQQQQPKLAASSGEDQIAPATYSKISQILRDLIKNIVAELARQKSYDGIWSTEIKTLFLNIYKECMKIDMHDKSEIFRYLAFKLSIKKTSLLKRCKRLHEKDQGVAMNTSTSNNNQTTATVVQSTKQPQTQAQPQAQAQAQNVTPKKSSSEINVIETAKQQLQLQQLQLQQQRNRIVKPEAIDDNILEPDLKEKIHYVIQTWNQTNPREFTFEINNYLNSIDAQARKLYNKEMTSKIYDYMAHSFKIDREKFMKKLSLIRHEFNEKQLRNSTNKFRNELAKEMRVQEERHNHAYAEFVKKLNEMQQQGQQLGEQEKRKIFGPRKKFVWSTELRDIFKNVLMNLMSLFETRENRALDKPTYMKEFLTRDIIGFWPEGWMQITALINESELILGWKQPVNRKPPPSNGVAASSQQQPQQQASNNVNKVRPPQMMQQQQQQQASPQPRKVVPERIQSNTAAASNSNNNNATQQQHVVHQQQRSQTNVNQQRVQNSNTPQQRPPQQQQNSASPQQQRPSQNNTTKQQQQQQKAQNAAMNNLASSFNLTPSQQKLFSSSNSLSLNSFLSSYLTPDPELQHQLQKQLQNLFNTSNETAAAATAAATTPSKQSNSSSNLNNFKTNYNQYNNQNQQQQ